MSAMFQKVNRIEDVYKNAVFGYVRSMEKRLSVCSIPALISYIILNYYYLSDYFAKYGKQVKVSNDNMKATKVAEIGARYDNMTFGNVWIDSSIPQIATWTLRTSTNEGEDEEGGPAMYVCIISDDSETDIQKPLYEYSYPFYALVCDSYSVYDNNHNDDNCKFHGDLIEDEMNDVLLDGAEFSISLNTADKTISIKKEKYQYYTGKTIVLYENIRIATNIKYKLGFILYELKDSMSLIDFDKILL